MSELEPLAPDTLRVLAGGGEMGVLMRRLDWAQTPVGPVEQWPQSLRTVLSILLASRHPIFVWWGPELIQFYNDAYRPILGATKHPVALGQRGRECWSEIWDVIAPMIAAVMERGEATFLEDSLLVLDRNGYLEECYFVYAYSPIRDEAGAVGGVFVACNETTGKVLSTRRLRTLRDLADHTVHAHSDEAAGRQALEVLGENRADLAFAALYLRETATGELRLVGSFGLPCGLEERAPMPGTSGAPAAQIAPLVQAVLANRTVPIDDVIARFGASTGGPWPEPAHTALALPLHDSTAAEPMGVLVVGLSPRLPYDDDYRGFLDLVADHLGSAVSHARAAAAERHRVAALAELDRAKTTFFSNISHEFRTPLTLLLGPVEEALVNATDQAQRERLTVIRRNALRLQKLVNMLLDFSRVEAGRLEPVFVPTDLAALTADLANSFRLTVEQAGLRLRIDCPPLAEPLYVDPDLYEQIVLNLLSNAFKFTFAGQITVALSDAGDTVVLTVADTGLGVAAADLGRIFERFHRIESSRGRTHEGTGIGLALVQELVKLHGGSIGVESQLGQGSTFRVTLPKGSAHLPSNRIGEAHQTKAPGSATRQVLEEVYGWSGAAYPASLVAPVPALAEPQVPGEGARAKIVWADDNADMREFVCQLLDDRYEVIAVPNGRAALEAVHTHGPDLVLADVMMPELDGFELVRALRANPLTRTLPIILLSARAGEQSAITGLETGVDDYLTKPFSAQELRARVQTNLQMARLRRESEVALRRSEERTRLALEVAEMGTWSWEPASGSMEADVRYRTIYGLPLEGPIMIKDIEARIHPLDWPTVLAARTAAIDPAGDSIYSAEYRVQRTDGGVRWVVSRGLTVFADDGATRRPSLMIGTMLDITERKATEAALRAAHDALERRVAERTHDLEQSTARLRATLAEKEVLLKEVHHRVKNNLQVIVSLLRLQAAALPELHIRELFREIQSRVQAMALVHEQLYRSPDMSRVPFADYVRRLANTLLRSYPLYTGQVHIAYSMDATVFLPIDTAVPLGLILTELISNSIKHAFPQGQQGTVVISLQQGAGELLVTVSDDGVGREAGPDLSQPASLGLQIVATLVEQLHATSRTVYAGGTSVMISIPNHPQ